MMRAKDDEGIYCEIRLGRDEFYDTFAAVHFLQVPPVGEKLRLTIAGAGHVVTEVLDVEHGITWGHDHQQQKQYAMMIVRIVEDERLKGWGDWKREDTDVPNQGQTNG